MKTDSSSWDYLMKGSDLALTILVVSLITIGVAATVAMFLVGRYLAVWLSLPAPPLVLGSFYAALGSSPSLLRARTNIVLVVTFGLVEMALIVLACELWIWLAALLGIFAFLTLVVGASRWGGA